MLSDFLWTFCQRANTINLKDMSTIQSSIWVLKCFQQKYTTLIKIKKTSWLKETEINEFTVGDIFTYPWDVHIASNPFLSKSLSFVVIRLHSLFIFAYYISLLSWTSTSWTTRNTKGPFISCRETQKDI